MTGIPRPCFYPLFPHRTPRPPSTAACSFLSFILFLSCFTQPILLLQFVFPDGMRLHSNEKPPTTFPFVLTSSSGLKMHGAVLHITEEIDPQHVGGMVSQALNSSSSNSGGEGGGGGQQHRGRPCAPLTPAQLPIWLRDTVRCSWWMRWSPSVDSQIFGGDLMQTTQRRPSHPVVPVLALVRWLTRLLACLLGPCALSSLLVSPACLLSLSMPLSMFLSPCLQSPTLPPPLSPFIPLPSSPLALYPSMSVRLSLHPLLRACVCGSVPSDGHA